MAGSDARAEYLYRQAGAAIERLEELDTPSDKMLAASIRQLVRSHKASRQNNRTIHKDLAAALAQLRDKEGAK